MTIPRNTHVPSPPRPLRLPRNVLHTSRLNGTVPVLTDNQAQPHVARNTAGALFPTSRRTRKTWIPPAGAFDGATSFSLTDTTLFLVLPIPPSINRQYATVNGRRVLAAAGRHYKRAVGQLLMASATSSLPAWHSFRHQAQEGTLILTIRFYFPTLWRRDLDGGLKITQDALCEAMNLNDNRIMEIHLYKILDPDHPRLECTLTLATSPPPPHRLPRAGRRSNKQHPR